MSESLDCPHPDDLLAVISGQLDDCDLENRITSHLGDCDRCQQLSEELAGWSQVAGQLADFDDQADAVSPALNAVVARLVASDRPVPSEADGRNQSSMSPRPVSQWAHGPGARATSLANDTHRFIIAGLSAVLALAVIVIAILWQREGNKPQPRKIVVGNRLSPAVVSNGNRPAGKTPKSVDRDTVRCVVMPANGENRREVRGLAKAVGGAGPNAVIEIHDSASIAVEGIEVRVPLTIRAAEGTRPVLRRPSHDGVQLGPILDCFADLTLEGVDIVERDSRVPSGRPLISIAMHSGKLRLSNCDIELLQPGFEEVAVKAFRDSSVEIHKCRFLGGTALDAELADVSITNSLLHGACPIVLQHSSIESPTRITLKNVTLVAEAGIAIHIQDGIPLGQSSRQLQICIDHSTLMVRDSLTWINRIDGSQGGGSQEMAAAQTHTNLMDWKLSGNVLAIGNRFLSHDRFRMPLVPASMSQIENLRAHTKITRLAQWLEAVRATDDGSQQVDFSIHDAMLRPMQFQDLELLEMSLLQHLENSEQPERPARD